MFVFVDVLKARNTWVVNLFLRTVNSKFNMGCCGQACLFFYKLVHSAAAEFPHVAPSFLSFTHHNQYLFHNWAGDLSKSTVFLIMGKSWINFLSPPCLSAFFLSSISFNKPFIYRVSHHHFTSSSFAILLSLSLSPCVLDCCAPPVNKQRNHILAFLKQPWIWFYNPIKLQQ